MKLYEALARALVDHRIDTLFGLIGDANLYMVDSYVRGGHGRYVAAVHEAGAVLMALGHAQVTGRVAVATITHGPALTNALTALAEGVKSHVGMVLLCGDTPVEDLNHLQSAAQRELVTATGAGFVQLRAPGTYAQDLATALRRAALEQRPVVLNIPVNFQWHEVEAAVHGPFVSADRSVTPQSAELDKAIGIIAAARRPIVLAGRGAIEPDHRAALIRLADRIGAPLATTLRARNLFAGEPFDLGIFGTLSTDAASEAIAACDCVIAFGAGLNVFTTGRGDLLRGKRLIHVEPTREGLGRHQVPDAGLLGDPGLTADLIVHWLDEAEIPPSGFRDDDALRRKLAAETLPQRLPGTPSPGHVDVRSTLLALNRALPEDRVLVTDAGRFLGEAWRVFPVRDPRSFVYTVSFGSIGLGIGQAIGAAIAAPDRPTVLITGDGGFMMGGLTEFNSAVRHRVDLIVILCNDGSYGAEHIQFTTKQMDPSLSLFDWPDFAPVAVALGGEGVTIRSPEDLPSALAAIAGRKGPLLIDIKVDPAQMPPVGH